MSNNSKKEYDLANVPTHLEKYSDEIKKQLKEENEKLNEKIIEYQRIMYAQGKYSMLIVLQWMDAAGKDWAVRQTFHGINLMWADVQAFKVPSSEEFDHDFLWRIHKWTPWKWMIQIFNRSHYEDMLVPYAENLLPEKEIAERAKHINNFEELLNYNNTIVLKFFLHVWKEKQQEKLNERLTNPTKHRKHEDDDYRKSGKYDTFIDAYNFTLWLTDTKANPWHIVPSDSNTIKVNTISKIVVEAFEKQMTLERPELETDMKIVEVEHHDSKKDDKKRKKD